MKMPDGDQKTYPKMAAYIKNEIPKLKNNATICAGLKKCGSLTPAQITQALSWGNLPTIKIVDMQVTSCRAGDAGAGLYGCTRSKLEIEVAKRVVEGFETAAGKSLAPVAGLDNLNIKNNPVYVLGVSLLHELCHWGNKVNNVAEGEEMGLKFERTVYGKTIW
jgi:hypothetical protein